ncbi:30S ribosomal protein S10, chloroplastic [Panicum miliaceum]|uniref:Small ribosomal subunit protein uS10c n=1 Tax=Panicum miliaceum TaxID=4540 RepID=A0A3L6SFW3_PANMI|nr:30S ribosomal protein S10, chloroplastic [Panicum miliaceum]
MAVSTSTTSPLPLLLLHRGTANPSPASLSFPSSLRATSLRSRAAAAPPAETLSEDGIPDAPPEGEGTGIPLPSSIGDDGEQLLYGTAGKEIVMRPCAQLSSSFSDSLDVPQEKIVIRNRYGEKLVGVLHEVGSKDIVVLCHGFRSSKDGRTILSLANALASENISIFRFDFSGNGESEGTFEYGNYYKEVDDLHDVILHFKKHKRDTHAIAGHSKGGNVVILYASMYHDIYKVINLSGRFNLKRGIGDRFGNDYMERINQHGFIDVEDTTGHIIYRVTKESLMDRLKTDMRSACTSIDPNCRVLTVHGANDDVVPSEDALEFDKYISNHELHIIEEADHRYASHQLELASILAPKQKIRIKLRSYWVPLIEDSCKKIIDAAKTTNAKTMGPVPLPTKRRVYCVLNSPHVHKDSRFHFEIRTHQRLIDIMYPTAQTIDSLMQLQLPAGVDVEVKL